MPKKVPENRLSKKQNASQKESETHVHPLDTLSHFQLAKKPFHTTPNLLITRHWAVDISQQDTQFLRWIKSCREATHKCRCEVAIGGFVQEKHVVLNRLAEDAERGIEVASGRFG